MRIEELDLVNLKREMNWEELNSKERCNSLNSILKSLHTDVITSNIQKISLGGKADLSELQVGFKTLDILQILETEIDVNNNEDIFANKYVVQEKISDYKNILLAFGN